MILAELCSRVRSQRGLSVARVAEAAGCKRQHIYDIEAGAYANLKTTTIIGLARALRVNPDVVLTACINSLEAQAAAATAEFQKGDTSG